MTQAGKYRKKKKPPQALIAYGGEAPEQSAYPSLPSIKLPGSGKRAKAKAYAPVLFRKTSTCFGTIKNLNIDYLDETSEVKAIGEGKIIQGIGYLSKEEVSQVHAGGFLHSELVKMQSEGESGPLALDNEIRKKRILKAWGDHIRRHTAPGSENKKIKMGHKLIFSLDSKFQKDIEKKGINTDMVVQSIMRDSLRKFAEVYHPGDRLGYAYGIHHDTNNLHIHVFVNPKTEKGHDVGISSALKGSKTNTWQKNKIGQIKATVNRNALKWEKITGDPEAFKSFSSVRRNQKYFYAPKIPADDLHLEAARRKLVSIEKRIKRRHEDPNANYQKLAGRFRRARSFFNSLKQAVRLKNETKVTCVANARVQKTSSEIIRREGRSI